MARVVDASLQALGATCVFERGEGDDDAKYAWPFSCPLTHDSLEEDFSHWKDKMWSAICVSYNVQPGGDDARFGLAPFSSAFTPPSIFTLWYPCCDT